MIPLQKLSQLPRSQRLRKAAKIIGEAEIQLVSQGFLDETLAQYLAAVTSLLAESENFSPQQEKALITAQNTLSAADVSEKNTIRRALNTAYHVLLSETGRYRSDWDFISDGGALDAACRTTFPAMQVYFEDIRSPFNVGAMFRAAESFGAEKIWLSPLCADPGHKRARRTAMGSVDIMPWERLPGDPFESERNHLSFALPVFALETGGVPLYDFPFPAQGVLIAGSEELGVSPRALAAADSSLGRVSIPTHGAKGSLNVSVAFGIVMQAWAATLHNVHSGSFKLV